MTEQDIAFVTAKNDQAVACIWDEIKTCFASAPQEMEYIRKMLMAECAHNLPAGQEGPIAAYFFLRDRCLTLGAVLLQERLREWIVAGEMPTKESR